MASAARDRAVFLSTYNLPPDAIEKCGLSWELLDTIAARYGERRKALHVSAASLAEQLRQAREVHSVRVRIKEPDHLVAKILRKTLERPHIGITDENYASRITDLLGLRVLHLFKEDWIPIHEFIVSAWELAEPPAANVRRGDGERVIQAFAERGCAIHEHPFGYRSVHYLIRLQSSSGPLVAEVQVRTIIEEAWSEIDHRIRYPYEMDNPMMARFLEIFNRLAGHADEMGSFIRFLKEDRESRDAQYCDALTQQRASVLTLKQTVRQLEISGADKQRLEEQIASVENMLKMVCPLTPRCPLCAVDDPPRPG
jgi:putative GTP pyrophosphokinase